MRVHKTISRIHKLVGLVIGLQIVLWISGGVVMSFFDIERVRGEHLIAAPAPQILSPDVLPPALAPLAEGRELRSVQLERRLDRAVAELVFADGGRLIADAASGERLSPFGEGDIRAIAAADYAGDAGIAAVLLIERDPPIEYRNRLPVWRVEIDDEEGTRLYVSPETGRVLARRNDVWRLYDFFWMLHIMDYQGREDFNHPLLIGAGLLAFLLATSGLPLLYFRLRRRDFGLSRKRRRSAFREGAAD